MYKRQGLLFFGNTTIPFVDRFPQNTELYAIMTTRPEDKKQEMNLSLIHILFRKAVGLFQFQQKFFCPVRPMVFT